MNIGRPEVSDQKSDLAQCQKGSDPRLQGLDPGKTEIGGRMSEVRFGRILAANDPAVAGVPDPYVPENSPSSA